MKNVLSYKEWMQTKLGESPEMRSHYQYLNYVNEQYSTFVSSKIETKNNTKSEYIQFVKELKNLFESDQTPTEIDLLDFDNEDELKFSIPYFSAKMNSIAKNISESRNNPKNTAIAYANTDSIQNLKCGIYEELINIHTAYGTIPSVVDELSGVSIEIRELFDDAIYMDKEADVTASEYFDISANEAFYANTENISSDLISWSLQSGFNPLVVDASESTAVSSFINFNVSGDTVVTYRNNISNAFLGESQYSLDAENKNSILTISASNPIQTPLNRYNPSIAILPLIDQTYLIEDVGDYNTPNSLGRSIFLGKNRSIESYNFSNVDVNKSHFPDVVWASNGVSLGGKYQNSALFANPTLNWMDIKYKNIATRGVIGKTRYFQEMVPYKTDFEHVGQDILGLSRILENVDPWTGTTDTEWADEVTYPIDFRILYAINNYTSFVSPITGSEYNWGIDIYGNNYALYKPTSASEREYSFRESSSGEIFIRGQDGYILPFSALFEGVFWQDTIRGITQYWDDTKLFGAPSNFLNLLINQIKEMQIYYNTLLVVDSNRTAVVQDIQLSEKGLPSFPSNKGHDFTYDVDGSEQTNYKYFGHFYDDRNNTLYIAVTKTENGQAHIKLYKWQNHVLYKILDTTNMLSSDLPTFSGDFVSYKNYQMDINPDKNELILCFTYNTKFDNNYYNSYICGYVYKLEESTEFSDIFTIYTKESNSGTTVINETRNIIGIKYFNNNLIFLVEGFVTGSKYLQILEI